MSTPAYDYYGLLASTWDLWRDDTANWSDRHFYLAQVRRHGEPVLDVGCGTGRLLLDYAGLGIDIDGVDNSPEMLQICRAKAHKLGLTPGIHQLDILTDELPRAYRTILAPSSVLQLMTAPAAAAQMLARCCAHLLPGGVFVASFAFDWRPGEPLATDWELLFAKVRPEDGATVRHWTRETRDPEQQLWCAYSRFEVERDGQIIVTEEQSRLPEGRWYSQAQAVALYRAAGLTTTHVYDGFSLTPAHAGSRLFTVAGVKDQAA